MLQIKELDVFYGPIQALKNVSIEVHQGEIVAIIGANGAGKSTLLKSIAGLRMQSQGQILYKGKDLPQRTHEVVNRGIALVPEGRRIFGNLTVYENLLMGSYLRKDKKEFQADLEAVYTLFPRLLEREKQIASTLSGGEQQMLAIGRALMSRPELLLLDEPSLGLAPKLVGEIFIKFKEINRNGMTILIVEQNAKQALGLAHKAYVLVTGKIMKYGLGKELLEDPEIQQAYLGKRKE